MLVHELKALPFLVFRAELFGGNAQVLLEDRFVLDVDSWGFGLLDPSDRSVS